MTSRLIYRAAALLAAWLAISASPAHAQPGYQPDYTEKVAGTVDTADRPVWQTGLPVWDCMNKRDRNRVHFDLFPHPRFRDVHVTTTFRYKWCIPTRFADDDKTPRGKPRRLTTEYEVNTFGGERLHCSGPLQWFQGVRYNGRFWSPVTGRNYNPPRGLVRCDPLGRNISSQQYRPSEVPWMKAVDEVYPRLAVNRVVRIGPFTPDPEHTWRGEWKPW